MTKPATFTQADLERLAALVSEAERAFASQPKALWSNRTYLAPLDAAALRRVLDGERVKS